MVTHGAEREDSGLLMLAAFLEGSLDEYLRAILQLAADASHADAGGALLVVDPGGERRAVELLPLRCTPLQPRAEIFRQAAEICRAAAPAEPPPLFHDSRSIARAVLRQRDNVLGLIQMESTRAGAFSAEHTRRLAQLAEDAAVVISRILLRDYAVERGYDVSLVGNSPKLLQMEQQIKVAASDPRSPVLISGERGSGKELAAYAVHYFSKRRNGPFLPVNSAAFADTLLSDELFGHERHSFTGAETSRAGIFKAAEGGTLFFDEIGDMASTVQASLLRVLDQGELRRIGRDKPIKVDVRIIGATNHDLQKMVAAGTFRADLYDRLNVFRIDVPSLRERRSDIHVLASYFLKKLCVSNGRHHKIENVGQCLSCLRMAGTACARPEFYDKLSEYSFPGNIRELRNLITRVASGTLDENLGEEHARLAVADEKTPGGETAEDLQLDAVMRNHIRKVLERTGNNKSRAARLLGIPLTTLVNKMKKLGL